MHERRRSVLYKRTTRYLRVLVESVNGSVLSTLSAESVGMWAGYAETKRIIHYRADGTKEILDLEKIKIVPPPVEEPVRASRPPDLPPVPRAIREGF